MRWNVCASEGASGDWAVVATAHPAKFERVVEPLIGREMPIPAPLAALLARPSTADPLPAETTRSPPHCAALIHYLAESASRAIMRALAPDQTGGGHRVGR